ncbi:MAG: hypothetical protein ACK4NV_10355 [Pannonibacter sp.]
MSKKPASDKHILARQTDRGSAGRTVFLRDRKAMPHHGLPA